MGYHQRDRCAKAARGHGTAETTFHALVAHVKMKGGKDQIHSPATGRKAQTPSNLALWGVGETRQAHNIEWS